MLPNLSPSQRVHLLRRAGELGLLAPGDLGPDLDPAQATLSESDLRNCFDRLLAVGKISEAFILQELLPGSDQERTRDDTSHSSLDRLGLLREADQSHPEMMAAFPLPKGGRYVPLSYLGDGGMGRVYKAYDLQLKRVVALKFLKHFEPEAIERFLQEGRAQAQIDHPHVANVYSVGQVEGHPYLAMRYIEGPTLRAALPQLNLEQKVRILADVAEALHACHRMGIIHRDMKPTNIMLERTETGEWWPFVMDFGLARELEGQSHTVTGIILGTPVYCSPEQVQGRMAEVDRRSDVYSLGATLYEALCGEPPFPAQGSLVDLIRRIAEADPPSLLRRVPNLPPDLEVICRKALEKESFRRYDSARALAEDLRHYLNGDPIQARAATLAYRMGKWVRKNHVLAGVSLGSLILIGALSAFAATTFLRARITARSAQRYGREAEQLESTLFKAQVLPLHDTRPIRREIEAHLESLRAEIARSGRWSEAAGRLALGRGYLALDHLEQARKELERARQLSPRDPETALSLGMVLARVFQQEMEGLRGKARDERRKVLEPTLLEPARACLRQGRELSPDRMALGAALLALVEDRLPEALTQAQFAASIAPWNFDALLFQAEAHRSRAALALARGDFGAVEASLSEAQRITETAQAIARSAPAVYRAEVQIELLRLQMRTDQNRALPTDRDRALEACQRVLVSNPEDVQTMGYLSAIHHRWAQTLSRNRQDPSQELARAIEAAERGLQQRPDDIPLLNNLASAHRSLAEWQVNHDQDPSGAAQQAIRALERGLNGSRYQDWLLNNLGICWSILGTHQRKQGLDPEPAFRQAQEAFKKAMSLRPWVGHAYCQGTTEMEWGAHLQQTGRNGRPLFEAATLSFQSGLDLNPSSFQCHLGLAEALVRMDRESPDTPDSATAQAHLDRALALNPALKGEIGALQLRIHCRQAREGDRSQRRQVPAEFQRLLSKSAGLESGELLDLAIRVDEVDPDPARLRKVWAHLPAAQREQPLFGFQRSQVMERTRGNRQAPRVL